MRVRTIAFVATLALIASACGGDDAAETTTTTTTSTTTSSTTTTSTTTTTTTTTTTSTTTTTLPPVDRLAVAVEFVTKIVGRSGSDFNRLPWGNDQALEDAQFYRDLNRAIEIQFKKWTCAERDAGPIVCDVTARDNIARAIGELAYVETLEIGVDDAGLITSFLSEVTGPGPEGEAFVQWLDTQDVDLTEMCTNAALCGIGFVNLAEEFVTTDAYVPPEYGSTQLFQTVVGETGSSGTFTTTEDSGLCPNGTFASDESEFGDDLWWFRDVFTCTDGSGSWVVWTEIIVDPTLEEGPEEASGTWLFVDGTGDYLGIDGRGGYFSVFDPDWIETYSGDINDF